MVYKYNDVRVVDMVLYPIYGVTIKQMRSIWETCDNDVMFIISLDIGKFCKVLYLCTYIIICTNLSISLLQFHVQIVLSPQFIPLLLWGLTLHSVLFHYMKTIGSLFYLVTNIQLPNDTSDKLTGKIKLETTHFDWTHVHVCCKWYLGLIYILNVMLYILKGIYI